MEIAISGQSCDLFSNSLKLIEINSRVFDVSILVRVLDLFPLGVDPVLGIEVEVLALLVGGFQLGEILIINFLQGLLRDSTSDKLLTIYVTHRGHFLDDGVHKRLCEGGLIELVVTHLAVAYEVNDHVRSEALTVLSSDAERVRHVVH